MSSRSVSKVSTLAVAVGPGVLLPKLSTVGFAPHDAAKMTAAAKKKVTNPQLLRVNVIRVRPDLG